MRPLLLLLACTLALLQGVGVLVVHEHPAALDGHVHRYVDHDHGHAGHADDVQPSELGHGDPVEAVGPTPVTVLTGLLAVVVIALLTQAARVVARTSAPRPARAPPDRWRVVGLAIQQV